MISVAILHSALDALCVDRSMPVEPLFQATFVYLFFSYFSFLSFPLFKRVVVSQNIANQWKATSLATKRSRGTGLGRLTDYSKRQAKMYIYHDHGPGPVIVMAGKDNTRFRHLTVNGFLRCLTFLVTTESISSHGFLS